MAEGHSYYQVGSWSVSPDNKILAFSEDTVSRRIYNIRFKNLETGEVYEDQIGGVQAGGAWANDNKTYFYTSKNKETLLSEMIWSHLLGEDIENDQLKYTEKDPSYYIGVRRSKSGKYIIIYGNSHIIFFKIFSIVNFIKTRLT